MNVLVIGGTGFISGRLVTKLLERGHDVTVLNRGSTRLDAQTGAVRTLTADRTDGHSLRSAVAGLTFDAVFDMVAYRPEESQSAVDVFRGRADRFIHCSTISVYMVSSDVQCPITEDQDKGPLMDYFPRNPFGMDYGINKRKCEEVLWSAHASGDIRVSILRPTFVCGPRDPAKRDWFWAERILDGGPILVPGSGDFSFQNVYIEDVASGFAAVLDSAVSVGRAYNVAAEEVFTLNEYLRLLSKLVGRDPEFVHVDQEVFDALPFSSSSEGDVFPFNTRRPAIFSLERVKRDLDYRSTPVSEWLPRTVEWFRREFKHHSNGYRRRQDEVEFAARWKSARQRLTREIRYD
jgi:nucleoside-diphosphate-sugar epimerase